VRLAVNVSPLQLRSRGFVDDVRAAIGIDPHAAAGLELEITESLIMEDAEQQHRQAAGAARPGRDHRDRRFRHRLLVVQPPRQAAGGHVKIDRSFIVT
jgi:predicted signal transduction protein with EAL and GGDEF domain